MSITQPTDRRRNQEAHGETRGYKQSKLYRAYDNIRKRCYSRKCPMYHRYGGRGIKMCEKWEKSRAAFFADVGSPSSPGLMIERINNDGGYWCGKAECPECGPLGRRPNCRWATADEQHANKGNNRRITHDGRTLTLAQWSKESGIPYCTLSSRLDVLGWAFEKAVTIPLRTAKRYEYNGESLTGEEWEEKTGIPLHTIKQRVEKLGWSVERAVTTPNRTLKRKPKT